MIRIWKCGYCGDVRASNDLQHHQMDMCKCEHTGVDLESYGCRIMGDVIEHIDIIEKGILRDMFMSAKKQGIELWWHEILEEERESYERCYK